jgi:hypothetical protein
MVGLLSMSSLTPQNATLRRASMIAFLIGVFVVVADLALAVATDVGRDRAATRHRCRSRS